jgi:hemolysin activation/secretion protein
LACALAVASPAQGQIPGGLPGAVEPGRDRPPIATPQQPNFDFTIEGPRRSPVPRDVDEIQFHLNDIVVNGAVTIPPERFRPLYKNLLGKDVSLSQILDVADAIEAEYRRAGYLLVRAFVPPQRVGDGNFNINVVEGFVANVSVEGADPGTQERIRAFLQPVLDSKPLQLSTMEQALLLTNDLPGVAATGVLRPSPDTPGASDLVVRVNQEKLSGGLAVDNRGSHFSGLWTITGDFALNSLFDDGDQLVGSVTTTPNFSPLERIGGQLRYRHAIGNDGLVASLIGTVTHGEPGSSLQAFNVLTDSWALGPRLTYPFLRTRAESLVLDAGLTFQEAQINFQGLEANHDAWRVLDVGLSYLRNGFLGAAWAANVDLAQGLPILGATDNADPKLSRAALGARTDFTKLTGGLRFTRPIQGPISIALGAQGQYAFDPLINGELFTFGGTQLGRGYDPGALTGDRGLGGSAELRYDQRVTMSPIQALQPYIYFDTGRVWNVHNATTNQNQNIESAGGGLRFWLVYNVVGGIEVSRTLDAVPGSDNGKRATKLLTDLSIRF